MKNDKRFHLMEHLFKPRPLAGLVLSSGLLLLLATWLTGGPVVTAPTTEASSTIEAAIMPQSEVFIVVNWPLWSSENQVELYNSSNTLLATVCDPSNCFNGAANSAYSASISAGCQDDGGGYYLILRDQFGDQWNGGGTVEVQDASGNTLFGPLGLANMQSPLTSGTFTVSGGGANCVPLVGPDDICVSVFNDYNSNGVKDGPGELGLEGITVTAYDASNNPSPFTYTSDGNYEFTPGNADTYRVEVTGIPAELEPTVAGATTVFFIDRGNKVEVGLQRPEEYFDDEVFIAVPCYVDGPSSAGAANANEDVLVVSPVSDMTPGDGNVSPTEYFIADHDQIGATFGVAYSRASNSIFASAFAKRHTAFGPSGTGAIYKVDLNGDAITAPVSSTGVSTIVDLNALFGANTAGADPHPSVGGTDFDQDPATYDQVGKIGLGGLAMSETENVLWTINLADRRLYEIPLGGTRENPGPPASAAAISRWPATGDLTDLAGLPGSAADKDINIRPFAVKCYRGEIYIGLVSTGESTVVVNAGQVTNTGDRSQMQGFIYKFNPATDAFTPVVSFPFDYTRGQAADFCGNNGQAEFNPWAPIYDEDTFETAVMGTSRTTPTFPAERVYPQPWITDIEFDEEGKMIIGVRDRFADQHGFNKLPPVLPATTQPDTFRFTADGAGDVLVASRSTVNADEFVLESNAENGANSEPFGPTTGAGFMEGPGGGEFFFDDRYRPSNAGPDGDPNAPCGEDPLMDEDPLLDPGRQQGHDEITLGGLFAYLGQELLVAAAYDPINNFNNFNNAGAIGLSTVDGSRQSASQIYATTVAGGVTFAKGNGLGDLEGLTPPAPLQIGNRLWVDGNNNGRQDADEAGLNGVLVELFKETAPGTFTKVAETTTAADAVQGNGFFIFSNNTVGSQTWVNGFTEVEEEMDYEIRVSLANVQAVDNTVMAFTTSNANGDSSNDSKTDLNDSDASPTGVIAVTSGRAGENNHTLDIGVTQSAVCSITIDLVEPSVCVPATNEYTLSVTVTYADAPAGEMLNITTDNGGSQSFSLVGAVGTETFILTGLTSDGVADIDVTATFATTTTCTDTEVDAYTAPADCTILPCSITVNSATASACDPGTNTYSLTVNVTYANAPAEDIVITTDNGGSQTFTPTVSGAGTESFTLTGLTSDGVADIDVTANFATTTGCTDTATDAYTAPANCTPCSITVNSATASACDPGTNTYSLTVNVTYTNAPTEDIVITTDNGGSQTFTPTVSGAGTESFTLTGLTSDGVADIDVTANFATTTGCTDTATDAYTAPANCTPCSITVNSATASVCDPGTNTYSLTVNVTYTNAPTEDIVITTDNGGSQTFTPTVSGAGTESFTLTGLTSDGVADIDVTANFATTTGCTDTATDAYTAPANCTPCSITVNSATPGACIPATNTYDLTVSVTYSSAPTEDIVITTDNGGSQTFTPTVAGAGTESFILTGLTSDGVADIDVTANFATTTGCTDTATDAYTAPDDCTPCSITVNSATPGACIPATNTYDLTVSVTYSSAPTEDIVITTDNGGSQTFTPTVAGAGTESFTLTGLTSDGVADIDVTANFATTTGCTDTAIDEYTAPDDCTPVCSIAIDNVTPSTCDPATNTYSLSVEVTYANAPAGEDIRIVTDNGVDETFTPAGTAGTETFVINSLISDGVADIDVMVEYETTTTCTDDIMDAYTAPMDCTPECELMITAAATASCAYDVGTGQSTFSVQVDLSWESDILPITPDVIEVTLDGVTLSTGALNTVTGTTSVTFTNVSGPAYGVPVTAAFANEPTCDANSFVDLTACTDPCVADGVGGNVFNDFNNDGADAGDSEVGQANVRVEVYDCAGMLVCDTWTDADGNWSCAALTDGEEYRVEFSTPLQDYLQPSAAGSDNGTNTQFVTAPSCDVDYGVISLSAYCDANPDLAIPCFVNGDPSATPVTGGVNTDDAFVQFSDMSTGNAPIPTHNGSAQQLGTVWGSAVQASTGRIFTAAMLKRHSGLGPGGIDGIYVLEDGVNNSAMLWLDGEINTDVSAAINPVSTVGAVPSNAGRNLGAKDQPNYDFEVFPLIGKVGYGDLDISEDEKTLYVVNLADRTLNLIDIASVDNGNPQITTVPIPDPGCNDGIARPWGLGVRDGAVYVGVVCTGELSGRTAGMTDPTTNLQAFVYAFRPETGFNETPALEFSLDYDGIDGNDDRGCTGSGVAGCRWFTWIDNFIDDNNNFYEQAFGNDVYIAPQPMLTDIEFDAEGYMVLNFTDRNGHQLGWINYKPDPTETDATTIRTVTGGDLLIASPDAGGITWTLENNASAGTRTSAGSGSGQTGEGGPNTDQGPGGGEFFSQDFLGSAHSELPAGSSAIIPGTNRLATASMDAIDFRSHGIRWYSTEDGSQLQSFSVFTGQTDTDFATTFGKAGGLGDLSYVCESLPIQIGNYVWIDDDEDGVQDPCEMPVEGVQVSLYNKDTDMFEQVTSTGPDGEYYFNDVTPNTNYAIVFGYNSNDVSADGSWDNTAQLLFVDGIPFELTVANSEDAPLPLGPDANDLNDSDATLMDMAGVTQFPIISYRTTDSTDHTLDMGLRPANLTSIGSTVFVDNNNNAMQDAGDLGIEGVELLIYQVVGAQDGNGNTETDDILLDVGSDGDLSTPTDGMNHATNAQGDYLFQNLPPGDYYIVIADGQFGGGEALADTQISSTDIGTTVGDNQTDSDDNGQQAGGAGTVVTSSVITLTIGGEPTDVGANPEDGQAGGQDNTGGALVDENGDMTIDFGFFAPVAVGDTAFVDLDGDGLQSAGDPGIGGVTVTLLDENGDQVTEDAEGNPITGTTTTAPDGSYRFDNLPPGIYSVTFDVSTADNAEFYDFTTANAGNDADDSDNSIPVNATTAQSDPTPFLNSGEEDLTLDVGVICAIEVTVADPFAVCSTQPIDLTAGASISPASLGGNWMSSGDGAFYDAAGDLIAGAAVFGTAVEYRPGALDIANGAVTLTLTTNEPDGPCGAVSASVTVQVLQVDCGQFMWDGN